MDSLQNNIKSIANNNYQYLMQLQNVNGVGLGFKHINGIQTDEPCIHVLVEKKINSNYLPSNNIIPKSYMGIKTDVIEIGVMKPLSLDELKFKIRPLRGGYSVAGYDGNDKFNTGTITCVVTKKIKGETKFFILSNNHVLAGYNEFKIGSKVIQPSNIDGGRLNDSIGELSTFVRVKTKNAFYSPVNYVDCAIAKIDKSLVSNIIGIVGPLKGIGRLSIGVRVCKVGKMTGLTKGIIQTISATINGSTGKKQALFKKQIIATTSSLRGDSGAPLLNNSNEILGILMSGDVSLGTATFNDIRLVLKALNVEIYEGK